MRKTLFKWHSYLAIIALIPLIIVSLTGSILVFKTEIDQWLMPQAASLPYGEDTPARPDHNLLQQHIEQALPNFIIGAWEIFTDGQEADRVYLIKKGTDDWHKIYFDPYAVKILSEPAGHSHYLTDWLLELHYTFMLNGIGGEHAQWGTVIGLIAAVILTFLGISGLIIHRKFWLQLFFLRLNKSARVITGDIHRLIGAWSSPIVLILGITGLYFNAMALYHELFEHPSEGHFTPTQPLYGSGINTQTLLDQSKVALQNFVPTYMVYPYEPEVGFTIFGHQPRANIFASDYSSTVSFDRLTGEQTSAIDGREASALAKTVDSFRELHFGSFAGLGSKLFWCLLGLAPTALGLTGLYIWWHRKYGKKRKKSGHNTAAEPSPMTSSS